MSRITPPRPSAGSKRQRLTQPPRFEGYPYLVSRIGLSALRHLNLVPRDWPRERIVATARAQAEANRFETVACFGPRDAVYIWFDNSRTWLANTSPMGRR